ncbi:CgeB family protein [Lichenihabitans psoromatis]|uniref:CgeB family protein n=1 Tax=Lichenihabitans psoromatis TaxID=2528642 RepID=UPI00103636CB|nr:glycosyltransferase [Lichenihabitans psoromatis]
MKIVVFGLAISSSWGNGHATLWRGLVKALTRRGHHIVFFERDVPYYALNRDVETIAGGALVLYPDWAAIDMRARREVAEADVAIVTSYCPDAAAAERLVLDARGALRVFYDLDTPVTLANLAGDARPAYVSARGFADYDLVLSYTGGRALDELRDRLGARRVAPLYGHVDPDVHRPVAPEPRFASALSYLGTYAVDRQATLDRLFIEPARRRPQERFAIGGAQYPAEFPWTDNIFFFRHLSPPDHPAFFGSGRITLNVTRAAMAAMGWCPSGRLFEAAACGTAILTDAWEGLDAFFAPGEELLVGTTTDDAMAALALSDAEIRRIAKAGRDRVLADHTSAHRARDFEAAIAVARAAPTPFAREA